MMIVRDNRKYIGDQIGFGNNKEDDADNKTEDCVVSIQMMMMTTTTTIMMMIVVVVVVVMIIVAVVVVAVTLIDGNDNFMRPPPRNKTNQHKTTAFLYSLTIGLKIWRNMSILIQIKPNSTLKVRYNLKSQYYHLQHFKT